MPVRPLQGRQVVIVDGARTPFLRSGTAFADQMAYQLGGMAVAGLMQRTALDPATIDRVIMGTVIAEPRTSNLAREIVLTAGLPHTIHAFTVTAACTSSNVAIASAVEAIAVGAADVVVAGGAETLSDVPIRFSRPVRQRLIAAQKARGPADYAKLLAGLRPADIAPDTPAIAEFTTDMTMGDSAERMAKRFRVTREAQDAFALRSHQTAAGATEAGLLATQIVPALVPPGFVPIAADNGIRADSSLEKLAKLPPVYDKRFGTVTAGNASFLTDGASAVLLMSAERAAALGYQPLATVVGMATTALDPREDLLLGPAWAIPRALDQAGLTLADVGVVELHEAFAAQVLANLAVMADPHYCRQHMGREGAVGEIDPARLNAWGGSLAIGHPFGATGARLVMTAARRMAHEDARWGLVSACAAGGLASAMVLRRDA